MVTGLGRLWIDDWSSYRGGYINRFNFTANAIEYRTVYRNTYHNEASKVYSMQNLLVSEETWLFKRYFHLNDSINMARKGITDFYVLCKGRPKTQSLLKRWEWKYSKKMCQLMSKLFPQNINRRHPLSAYIKLSKKLTFPTAWNAHVRVHIWGLEVLIFQKMLRKYLMDGPSPFAYTWLWSVINGV